MLYYNCYLAHAEARKAPGLDGKVERDADGKEVRYPVILSAREKMIARRVVLAFGVYFVKYFFNFIIYYFSKLFAVLICFALMGVHLFVM